jgi:excisionase family DNA binding protein
MQAMLTIQQVAVELGVSKSRVFQYIREGRLEAQRIGIQDLIARAHLNAVKTGLRKTATGRPKKAADRTSAAKAVKKRGTKQTTAN